MIRKKEFGYEPGINETEKASNSYLMSLVAIVAGLPLPIINLLATLFFYIGNRKGTYFVRWHCLQALFSQLFLFFFNSYSFWWTMSVIFGSGKLNNAYIAYIITVIVFNLSDLVSTIYSAVMVRRGIHVQWWFFGSLTNLVCKS